MTQNEFVNIMIILTSAIKRNDKLADELVSICKKVGRLNYNDDKYVLKEYICDELIISQLIDYLQDDFGDMYDTIYWWIYDCDFGTNHAVWYDDKNKKHTCKTIEQLYYMLTYKDNDNEKNK